jgi:hypothetical protein
MAGWSVGDVLDGILIGSQEYYVRATLKIAELDAEVARRVERGLDPLRHV